MSKKREGPLRALWRFLVDKLASVSGRRLRPTRAGQAVLVLAFTVGFAAMNTGNNLLFFGWGLILSSIVISGILSESTLQAATPTPLPPEELRAAQNDALPVLIENQRRFPGFGVEVSMILQRIRAAADDVDAAEVRTGAAFELRLSPGSVRTTRVPFRPSERGALVVKSLRVATAAPFGFFSKERVVRAGAGGNAAWKNLVVLPERIDTRALGQALWARLGETPAGHAGSGDELFTLRPYRPGDDPRRIAWRRAAKTGRLVVRENEATRSREILVDVRVAGATKNEAEDAVATAGSLVEDLLNEGHSVGVRAPGLLVPPSRSPRQRHAVLFGLALCDVSIDVHSDAAYAGAAVIAVVAGTARADDADVVVRALPRQPPIGRGTRV
ncbi:MAG: DUF58 domain-containing protein [Deltaproteobacteria bacterium]|nr:DUF58 domain-containing protein [Deltaproteobacteria bacterium]